MKVKKYTRSKQPRVLISRSQEGGMLSKRESIRWTRQEEPITYKIIALMPVWNAGRWLPNSLKALENCVDAIIALDDGSTDNSLELLKSHSLITEIIKKPSKELVEWHDAQNHYELYLAAAKYLPEWLIFVDADEVLEPTFKIFKHSLVSVAKNIKAFAFHVAEMDGDIIIRKKFAHRMFRYKSGYTFDNKRLHCRPLPLEITLDEIKLVNIRLLHAADQESREFRFEKYLQADPVLSYQSSYDHLLNRFLDEKITSMGGEIVFSNVTEDGLQRRLMVRRIKRFNKLFLDDECIQNLINTFYHDLSNDIEAEKVFSYFLKLNLDAYLIGRDKNNQLIAQYSYDSSRDVPVTVIEAWLIEEMHHHRDVFKTTARLHLVEKSLSPRDTIRSFSKLLEVLIRKKILKLSNI